ncbi:hypothetical protein [Brevundimonas sp.]|uniref:hypothetical protein n=1 Tax=Brevundimonas sp. TaxID=1871086 RepID=UPI00248874B6|nr:hypothetical protein [Brevundimonas sp.]MDI1281507.1 hypothetical protein [Brevundimonas sp.]
MPKFLNSRMGLRALALLAVAFGALTLKEGGGVLFGPGATRAAAGDYVPFVLWSNFLLGFAYVGAGLGLWLRQSWGLRLAALILAITLATFVAFAVHVALGGDHETRTLVAMSLRTLVWGFILLAARGLMRTLIRRSASSES